MRPHAADPTEVPSVILAPTIPFAVEEMPPAECASILQASRLGYLGLGRDGAAYVIPVYYAFDGDALWMHCHPGQKEVYIDTTTEACLTVVHYESEHVWESVQVFGPLTKATLSDDIEAAKAALIGVPFPPLPGHYPGGLPKRSQEKLFYLKLAPTRMAGKKSEIKEEVKA